MRPTSIVRAVRIPAAPKAPYTYNIPELSQISHTELPNNGFGTNNYSISKTRFKQWPVYIKKQNLKLTTEIMRVKGDVNQLKADLQALNPNFQITTKEVIGHVLIKGDHVKLIKSQFDQYLKDGADESA